MKKKEEEKSCFLGEEITIKQNHEQQFFLALLNSRRGLDMIGGGRCLPQEGVLVCSI